MKMKYEEACRMEGLSEEQTKMIRQVYNTDYKKMEREEEYRRKTNLVFNSISAMVSDVDGVEDYELADSSMDPEKIYIEKEEEAEKKSRLDLLRECLKELPEDEQELLLAYYAEGYGIESQLARELGMERKKFIRTREKLLKKLQGIYFEKYKGDMGNT